ncbi:hypothetical protein AS156_15100 [Bradyrhizobium macuxiense]|uniref:Uncharacterized protein n=1 Tax=Bradyrhizobium macuxiense TaxID=1755647 RepID=A0A109JJ87_9BRAD|nr:hypothetical protein AS156_15100 [Bradyrhizobium macuxiense]
MPRLKTARYSREADFPMRDRSHGQVGIRSRELRQSTRLAFHPSQQPQRGWMLLRHGMSLFGRTGAVTFDTSDGGAASIELHGAVYSQSIPDRIRSPAKQHDHGRGPLLSGARVGVHRGRTAAEIVHRDHCANASRRFAPAKSDAERGGSEVLQCERQSLETR